MRKAAENLGQNLIVDGDFSAWDDGSWQKGVPNKYNKKNDNGRSYLFISGQGSIEQTIELPLAAQGEELQTPFYSLTFDYKSTGSAEHTLTLVFIHNGQKRDPVEVVLEKATDWTPFTCPLALAPDDNALSVTFYAGPKAGNLGINVTDIDLQLHLEPLRLAALTLDGKEIPLDTPQLCLNHGRAYPLTATPEATSQWLGQQSALSWQSTPPVASYGIRFTPDLEVSQLLSEQGASWEITCLPYQPGHERGHFTLALVSHYSAEPFLIEAELDDFLYKLGQAEVEGIPIIDIAYPAQLKIRVLAEYEEERGIADVKVYWQVEGEAESEPQLSGPQGEATLRFLPKTAGDYTITARITDETGRECTHAFTVTAYQNSPWASDTTLTLDETMPIDPLYDRLYLRNGQVHTLRLRSSRTDDMFGKVGLSALEEVTGIIIRPAEKRSIPAGGLVWEITLENVDSQTWGLRLESDNLPVVQDINVIIVQDSVYQELEALEAGEEMIEPGHELLLPPQQPLMLRCAAKPQILGLQATLTASPTAIITAAPPLGSSQPFADGEASWALQGQSAVGGAITLKLAVPPLATPVTLQGRLLPQVIASGIREIRFDDIATVQSQELLLTQGRTHNLHLVSTPLLYGVEVFLALTAESGLEIISDPLVEQPVALGEQGASWTLRGDTKQRGRFTLEIESHWGGSPIRLAARLLAVKLADDIEAVTLDGAAVPTGGKLLLLTGETQTLQVMPDEVLTDVPVTLSQQSGVALTAQPSFGQALPIGAGGGDWRLNAGNARGEFTLTLSRDGVAEPYELAGYVLSVALKDEIERVRLDDKELIQFTGLTWQRGRIYEIACFPSNYFVGFNVTLTNPSDNNITIDPDQSVALPEKGRTWLLTMGDGPRGDFSLALRSSQAQQQPLLFSGVLLSEAIGDEVARLRVNPNSNGATYDVDFASGLVLLASKYYELNFTLQTDSLLKEQEVGLVPLDDGAVDPTLVLMDPLTPQTLPAVWEIAYNNNQKDLRFTLQLAHDNVFAYGIPTRVFINEKYLVRSQCEFYLDGVKLELEQEGKVQKIERNKEVALEVKLSAQAQPMLQGLSFTLLSTRQDALEVSPKAPITVTPQLGSLHWQISHDVVMIGSHFTLEVTLSDSRILKTIIDCESY